MIDQKIVDNILKGRVADWHRVCHIPLRHLTEDEKVVLDRGYIAFISLRERYPEITVKQILEELKP